MVWPIELAPICLPSKDVAVHCGHVVLMKVEGNALLIAGDPRGILDQQLRPHPIHLLIMIIMLIKYFNLFLIEPFQKLRAILPKIRNGFTCKIDK
jgi:hypothetical protein